MIVQCSERPADTVEAIDGDTSIVSKSIGVHCRTYGTISRTHGKFTSSGKGHTIGPEWGLWNGAS